MSDTATTDEIVDLEFDLPEPPAKVWRALVEPEIVARWIEPERQAPSAGEHAARYELLDAQPQRRVSYRWREAGEAESIVTFSVATNAVGGTRLRIVHSQAAAVTSLAVNGPLACRVAFGIPHRHTFIAANLNLAAFSRAA
jgi:uncharacterized protein YndB with AHSA1/START domain